MAKVSIGIPVYNGENYLEEALDSILTQTFTDFEVIICDNASTDRTETIARKAAERDSRVHYFRNESNLGAAPNFNKCLELSRGEYFRWAAHDDLCLPEYLERCLEVLEADPGVAACHSETVIIDSDGKHFQDYHMETGRWESSDPIRRFINAISEGHWCFSVFAVIRRSVLIKTSGIGSFIGSDRNLIAQVVLQGRLLHTPHPLFLSRDHSGRSVRKLDLRQRGEWFDTSRSDTGRFYFMRLFKEHARILFASDVSVLQKARGFVWLCGWFAKRIHLILRELLNLR